MAIDRLDQYVIGQLPDLSRSAATRLIEGGNVLVNDKEQLKSGYKIRLGDKIDIKDNSANEVKPENVELKVIYEDDDCVVVIKPLGLLTHSKGVFNPEATVASWLAGRLVDIEPGERAGIVHRLDRATSGVMICAKTQEAQKWLQGQFSKRNVKKTYLAVVKGDLEPKQAIIDMPIARNPKKPQTFRVSSNGKSATTAYKVLDSDGKKSLVELKPTTGRTHQLRVHMEELGHPIFGDTFYGGPKADRLYLHALSLEITLLNRERKVFDSPAPKDFKI